MVSCISCVIAGLSLSLCLVLWFREVRKVMSEKRSTVESAAGQYYACCQRMTDDDSDAEVNAVCERSLRIYRQALDLYEEALAKPLYHLPARLMGFRNMR